MPLDWPLWARLCDGFPACWTWPLPAAGSTTGLWDLMLTWQAGRCAICGCRDGRLLRDHDHATSMTRGLLCDSCNTLERSRPDLIFKRYRLINPATICGLEMPYTKDLPRRYTRIGAS